MVDDLIKVRATHFGYHDARRRVGDVFEVPRRLFSATWMEEVEPHTPLVMQTSRQAEAYVQQEDLTAIAAGKPRRAGVKKDQPTEGDAASTGSREVI